MVVLTNFLDHFRVYLLRYDKAGFVKVAQCRFVNGPNFEQGVCGKMNNLEGITLLNFGLVVMANLH